MPRGRLPNDDPRLPKPDSMEIVEEDPDSKEVSDDDEAEEETDDEVEYNSDGDQVFHITDIFDTSTGKSFFV